MNAASPQSHYSPILRVLLPVNLFIQRIPEVWRYSLIAFFAGRIFFSFWGIIIWKMRLMPVYKGYFYYNIEPIIEGIPGALLGMWQRWDSIHYQRIVMFGYEDSVLTAYFPLYPLLSKVVSTVLGVHSLVALILISNLALLFAMVILYKIVEDQFSVQIARSALFSLIIFPTSFFLYSIYPQSMLLLWSVLSYWLATRGKWLSVAVVGILAGLTHPTSAVISILLGWEALHSIREKKPGPTWLKIVAPVTSFMGVGIFMAWRSLAGFESYTTNLHQVWARGIKMPWEVVAAIGKYFLSTLEAPISLDSIISIIYILFFGAIVFYTIWGLGKIHFSMWLFQTGLLLMIFTISVDNDPLLGITRYPVVIFPLFIEMALLGRSKIARLLKFTVCISLSFICSALFFMWKSGFF